MSRLVKQSLVAASIITIGTNVLGRVFGFAREAAVANFFGTSSTFDVFVLAFTVPELLTFIGFAALPPALIPLIRRDLSDTTDEPFRLFWNGLVAFSLIFGLMSLAVYLARGELLSMLAPKLTVEQTVTGERLMTILSWFVFFRGIEAFFRSWLYDRKHFIAPATSPIIANLIILGAMYWLYGELDIEALAYGWLFASMVLFGYNGLMVFLLVRPQPFSGVYLPTWGRLSRAAVTVGILVSISLIYPVVDRYLAAVYLGEGQIAALRYATFLAYIPPGMLVTSFAMASFPWISDLSAPEQVEKLRNLYRESLRLVIFMMAVIAGGMVVFAGDIVRVAFQRGAFDAASLHLTQGPFRFFSLGIVFYSIHLYQIRFYYASTRLVRLGVIFGSMLLIKCVMSVVLIGSMEQDGLALATALAWVFGCTVMTVDLTRSLRLSRSDGFVPFVARVGCSMAGMGVFWLGASYLWPGTANDTLAEVFTRLALLGIGGSGVYFGLAALLKLAEPKKVLTVLRSRVL